ncbi:lycopene cyclase domain-containing protein [Algivirga pacifica]|uniref:Lycopene cyclase domain-containing protein n=1 Tax=Algivirga pacifica TaxID=1162670 RepID=A0ABP9D2N5_9BACT
MSLYLWIDLLVIIFPLLLSFDKKVHFYTYWKALWPAITVVGTFFILWDILFTAYGVWGFNPRYLQGIAFFGLPIEEILFFVTVPYACIFTHYVLTTYFPYQLSEQLTEKITLGLQLVLGGLLVIYWDNWYTASAFAFTLLLIMGIERSAHKTILRQFYWTYLVMLLPFLLVNGVLTGTGIEEEVVWYNEAHFMGFRILTIPLEDSIYGMGLILGGVFMTEYLRKKKRNPRLEPR